jgi:hypothetical protein
MNKKETTEHFKKKIKDERPKLPPKEQLNIISQFFINTPNGRNNMYEMEAKFGTRGIKHITKLDYDNVVKKLKSLGFTSENEVGTYTLKIQQEFLDSKTGEFKTSRDFDRFRVEIVGLTSIQEYCKTNSLNTINEKSFVDLKILKKLDVRPDKTKDEIIETANFDDFNFRVSLKNEETLARTSKITLELIDNWNKGKKVFRYMNRVSFKHKDLPFQVDLSIVKSSTKNERGFMNKTHNIDESNVFKNKEEYEIEVEVLNEAKSIYRSPQVLVYKKLLNMYYADYKKQISLFLILNKKQLYLVTINLSLKKIIRKKMNHMLHQNTYIQVNLSDPAWLPLTCKILLPLLQML